MTSRINHTRSLELFRSYSDVYRYLQNLEETEKSEKIEKNTNFFDHVHQISYNINENKLREFFPLLEEALIEGADLNISEIPQSYSLPYLTATFPNETGSPFIQRNIEIVIERLGKEMAKVVKKYEEDFPIKIAVLYIATDKNKTFNVKFQCVSHKVDHKMRKLIREKWVTLTSLMQKKIHKNIVLEEGITCIQNYRLYSIYSVNYDETADSYESEIVEFPAQTCKDRNVSSFLGEFSINYDSPIGPNLQKTPLVILDRDGNQEIQNFVPEINIDFVGRELNETRGRDGKIDFLYNLIKEILLPRKIEPQKLISALADNSSNYVLAKWIAQECQIDEEELDYVWKSNYMLTPSSRQYNTELIYKWAREDFKKYIAVSKKSAKERLKELAYKNGGKIGHADSAQVLFLLQGGRLCVDTDGKDYKWLEFVYPHVSHRANELWKWRTEVRPETLHRYIANEFKDLYSEVLHDLRENIDRLEDPEKIKSVKKIIAQFNNSRNSLSDDAPQNKIVNQACYYFRNRGLIKDMDKDGRVLGVYNGILLLDEETKLISGAHDFKVSKCAPVEYVEYNFDCPRIKRKMQIYLDIFGSEEVRDWFLVLAASMLDGLHKSDVLVNMIGPGSNGKSIFLADILEVLGDDYATRGGIELLCDKRIKQGQANPALMRYKGRRAVILNEGEQNEEVRGSNLKNIVSHGDKMDGRDLYNSQENFDNFAQTIVATNHEFVTNCHEEGFWRRWLSFTVPHLFVPDPKKPNEKLIDKSIEEMSKDPKYKSATLAILVHYYSIYVRDYKRRILNYVPEIIKQQTYNYRKRYDTLYVFISKCIRRTENREKFITIKDVAHNYKEWFHTYTGYRRKIDLRQTEKDLCNSREFTGEIEYDENNQAILMGYELIDEAE